MTQKKYKQLKLSMEFYQNHYGGLFLSFKLGRKTIDGILYGDTHDWFFQSSTPDFLYIIPSGILKKYALWIGEVPKEISTIYNSIIDAAFKAGYNMLEKEESESDFI
jgi:hypothetical protein